MFNSLLLAQGTLLDGATAGSTRLTLNASGAVSRKIAESWDYAWEVTLSQGGLYQILVNFGLFIAAGCLLLWCLKFMRQWMQEEASTWWAFSEIIYPVLVIILLANGGDNLAKLSMGIRGIINGVNQQVIEIVAVKLDLEQKMSEINAYSSAQGQLVSLRQQCNTITDNEKLKACLENYSKAADGVLAAYRSQYGNSGNPAWLNNLKAQVQEAVKNPGDALQGAAIQVVNTAMSPLLVAVEVFVLALQVAFQHLIEVSMLLTAIMGPLAVGASLLPFGAKPIFAWLSAFWGLGLFKLSYNVIAGLMAISAHKLGPTDTLVTAVFFGLLSPILAAAIARGGGMAVFNGILAASTAAAGIAAGPIVTGAVGRAAAAQSVANNLAKE